MVQYKGVLALGVVVVALFMAALSSVAADRHPINVHDLNAMRRVSGLAVSPNGKYAAFSVRFWVFIPSTILLQNLESCL